MGCRPDPALSRRGCLFWACVLLTLVAVFCAVLIAVLVGRGNSEASGDDGDGANEGRPDGPCALRGNGTRACHGRAYESQYCAQDSPGSMCVLCDADTDAVQCRSWSERGSCGGWTFSCAFHDGTARSDCQSDFCEGRRSTTQIDGFRNEGFCQCSGGSSSVVASRGFHWMLAGAASFTLILVVN